MAAALMAASCKGPKQIQQAIAKVDSAAVTPIAEPTIDSAAVKADIMNRVEHNRIEYSSFTGKIKLDFTDEKNKNNTNATAFVRIRKDSLVWVSLTGAMGIEGFRVLVSPDSVWVMDKLKKTYSRQSVAYLQDIIKLPVDFYVLQDLIVGNPVYFPNNIVSFKSSGNSMMALSVGEFFKHIITLNLDNNQILHSKLDDVDALRNRTCDITLADYTSIQNRNFSNTREITVTEKTKLDIRMEFKQVSFDEPVSFPFNIPKSYQLK